MKGLGARVPGLGARGRATKARARHSNTQAQAASPPRPATSPPRPDVSARAPGASPPRPDVSARAPGASSRNRDTTWASDTRAPSSGTSTHGRGRGIPGPGHGSDIDGSRPRARGRGDGPARGVGWFRRWYGAQPLHLLALIAAFALAGYAVRGVVEASQWRGFALWFAVAIVGHDLLLFPLYSLADLSVRRLLPGRPGARRRDTPAPAPGPRTAAAPSSPSVINYLRVPTAFSLLLLLVWFPLILGLSEHNYHRASGLVTSPYLGRWLAVTGVLFAASAASYALALRRASAPARRARRSRRPATSAGGPGRPDVTRHASRHRRHRIH